MAEVLPAPSAHDGNDPFSSDPLLRRTSSQPSLYIDTSAYSLKRGHSSSSDLNGQHATTTAAAAPADNEDVSSEDSPLESPDNSRLALSRTSSFRSTPPSCVSLDMQYSQKEDKDDDDELSLPSFGHSSFSNRLQSAPPGSPNDVEYQSDPIHDPDEDSIHSDASDAEALLPLTADDTAVKHEPQRQVDYLSHEWREEDIWESWKHIVSRRKYYGERSRLENASWRTWAKQKNRLETVSPETLNWLKDCDVTWLYGPLQEAQPNSHGSEPPSRLSKSNSFLNKKPILKKRSVSEEMLQKSLSSSSLIKQAAAAVQAQRSSGARSYATNPPRLRRSVSDVMGVPFNPDLFSNFHNTSRTGPSTSDSDSHSPDLDGPKRHIRFDNNVEQCIAVDFKDFTIEDESKPDWTRACSDSDSDEDDMPMMKTRSRLHPNTPSSSRNSFSDGNTGIAKLPSTTLKAHAANVSSDYPTSPSSSPWKQGKLSPSPSQETIRPGTPRRRADFILEEDEDEDDLAWEPSGAFGSMRGAGASLSEEPPSGHALMPSASEEGLAAKGMRRTPSGMFMPLGDENEDEDSQVQNGILGRVVDTVNTARDIAYVLYNVGWRR